MVIQVRPSAPPEPSIFSDVCPVPPRSAPALMPPPRTTSRKQRGYCPSAKSKSNSPVGSGHGGVACAQDVVTSAKVVTPAMAAAIADRPILLNIGAYLHDLVGRGE